MGSMSVPVGKSPKRASLGCEVSSGSMLSINVFRGASEQHCFKIGVRRATSIKKTRRLDSILAHAPHVADFVNKICHKQT